VGHTGMTADTNIKYSKIGITLPSDLSEKTDKIRHDLRSCSWSVFIRRALESYIHKKKE
jgi:metal-responsive CopG/Arc/MetJ family transcriptional regulator